MTPPLTDRPSTDWRPGDPLYESETMSYTFAPTLSEPCPPDCWHYAVPVGGYAMRWSADAPVLRFLRDGFTVTGFEPPDDDMMLTGVCGANVVRCFP